MIPVDSWGLFPWTELNGPAYVHPDDLEMVRKFDPHSKVFRVSAVDETYLTLEYGDVHFRGKPDLFRPVAPCQFRIGDTVSFQKGGVQINGVIYENGWHYKRNEPFYFVRSNGKKISKSYWSQDFTHATGTNAKGT